MWINCRPCMNTGIKVSVLTLWNSTFVFFIGLIKNNRIVCLLKNSKLNLLYGIFNEGNSISLTITFTLMFPCVYSFIYFPPGHLVNTEFTRILSSLLRGKALSKVAWAPCKLAAILKCTLQIQLLQHFSHRIDKLSLLCFQDRRINHL